MDIIHKQDPALLAQANLRDYDAVYDSFSWDAARAELDGLPGGGLNIAYEAVDRHLAGGGGGAKVAIRWLGKDGSRQDLTYKDLAAASNRFANVLKSLGVARGDAVFGLMGRRPELYEAMLGILKNGSVFSPLFSAFGPEPLKARMTIGSARALVTTDALYNRKVAAWRGELPGLEHVLLVRTTQKPLPEGCIDLSAAMAEAAEEFAIAETGPEDRALLHFTSGTTGKPKGVVYHHRGAYLNAVGNMLTFGLGRDSVYLWTLPMFHCDGWTFTWAVTAANATHVCLRKIDPAVIYPLIGEEGVTHMCGAPIVLTLLAHAPAAVKVKFPQTVDCATGGAAPPSAVIEAMEANGFRVIHLYGLTECYGPATVCAWQDEWADYDLQKRSGKMARQGVNYLTLEAAVVMDPETMTPVPHDGETLGEIMVRGNVVMKGYLKNPAATDKAFKGGWFHSGDLAVWHPDGYIELKDRSKDIIISGGENISSIEIEDALYRHPAVAGAAVVAKPDEKWGEIPCAFVELKPGSQAEEAEIIAFCRDHLAHFKAPKKVVFGPLPKTSTGKIQKFVLREQAKAL